MLDHTLKSDVVASRLEVVTETGRRRWFSPEATVAQVLVSKYADHLPLYQAQIYARQGIELDRSTLADWVGQAAFHLLPLHERLLCKLR